MNPITVSKLKKKKHSKREIFSVNCVVRKEEFMVANGILFLCLLFDRQTDLSNNNVTTTHYSQSSLWPRCRPIPKPELKPLNREREVKKKKKQNTQREREREEAIMSHHS